MVKMLYGKHTFYFLFVLHFQLSEEIVYLKTSCHVIFEQQIVCVCVCVCVLNCDWH